MAFQRIESLPSESMFQLAFSVFHSSSFSAGQSPAPVSYAIKAQQQLSCATTSVPRMDQGGEEVESRALPDV